MDTPANPSQRLYQRVADRLVRFIQARRFEPGDRLPAEMDLAKEFGVSRPTIREAMIALEIAGHVEIRSGSGAYVRSTRNQIAMLMDAGPSPFDLLRARLLIEGEIAADAATHATEIDLRKMEVALKQMKALVETGQNAQIADREFHRAIAEATGNAVLTHIVDSLWSGIFAPMFHALSQRTGLPEHQEMTLKDHEAIFRALTERSPQAARLAMRRHLRHVEDILAGEDVEDAVVTEETRSQPA